MSQTEIVRQKIELQVPGSSVMTAYVARPASDGPHPGLLVFQEAFGVNAHIRNVTDRFAAQGYVAIAPELFHRTAPAGFEGDYKNFPSVMPHYQAVTNEAAEADIRVTYEWLRSNSNVKADNISCVGFCMGGRISFLANTVVPMRVAVSYYGGGIGPSQMGPGLVDRAATLHGPTLLFWGGLDKHIPAEQRKAVTDALHAQNKTYVNVEFSNADHAFFCDDRAAYQPDAARQSWALTLEFLRS
ncbi:MAG TPA: dienelactone hydrolase family protein [Candidatus Sulfotelmatobacter sp.]|nr:dienelactone hydrolase family protein [Candidatus Sulfotelmatobacter sp.]